MTDHEYLLQIILPHASQPRVLFEPEGEGWTLPRLEMDGVPESGYDLAKFGMSLDGVTGCAAIALYSPYYARKTDEHGFRMVIAAENRDPSFQPAAGSRWITREELDGLSLCHEYLRPVLETYFHEQATRSIPPERPPWAYPGWLDRAHAWIAEQVAVQGWQLTGDIELSRKWCITCMLKAPTDAGMLYFKAVPETFAREIEVTRYLAAQFPDRIPSIVAAEPDQHWLLMRDFGDGILGDTKDVGLWTQAMRDYAALQAGTAAHIDALLACGAMDYRLETLPDKLDAMLADDVILQPDRHLDADGIARLRGYAPRIKALLQEMQDYGVPPTIVHTDFHPWNVVARPGQTIVFDWTDASIGLPQCDTAYFFDLVSREIFTDQPAVAAELAEAYLSALSPLAPVDLLRTIQPLGQIVGFVQQAVNYHHLLRHIEPAERWSLSFMTFLLKQLLTRLEAQDPSAAGPE